MKKVEEDQVEKRVAFEVSVSKMEIEQMPENYSTPAFVQSYSMV